MFYRILSIAIFTFCTLSLYSQISLDTLPMDDNSECISFVEPLDHPDYLSWLANNAGGVATSDCGGVVTWTTQNITVETNTCYGGYITVEWDITDDCSNDNLVWEASFEVFTESPRFDGGINNLILDCGGPNHDALIADWLATYGGANIISGCTPESELIITNDYDGTVPGCNSNEEVYVLFEITDACGTGYDFESAAIDPVKAEISFSSFLSFFQEDDVSAEFCIIVEDGNLDASIDFDVVFSETSFNSATNGVDYGPFNSPVTYTIPAGPAGEYCFPINIIDDMLIEGQERIDLELTNLVSPLNEAYISYSNETIIFIEDNDDVDGDLVENSVDNCPNDYNPLQEDIDGDGIGNPCDAQNIVSELQTVEDNIFLDSNSSGVITRSPDGNCWMMFVQNDGSVGTVNVVCPN